MSYCHIQHSKKVTTEVPVCISVGVVLLVSKLHQFGFRSTNEQNLSPVDLPVYLLKDKHICVYCLTHCVYGYGRSSTSSLQSVLI